MMETVKVASSMQRNKELKRGLAGTEQLFDPYPAVGPDVPSLHVAVVGNSPENQLGASGVCGHSKMICSESGGGGAVCLPSPMIFLSALLYTSSFLTCPSSFQSFDVLLLLLFQLNLFCLKIFPFE